jgi:predicted ArsR family transcriptional regulator
MAPEFNDDGQFKKSTTLDDVLAAFEELAEPVVFTSEIADAVECSRETARQRLTDLYEAGRIQRRKKGRQIVWWRGSPADAEQSPEQRLKWLSRELDQSIVVGNSVYKDGDKHPLLDAAEEVADDE